MLSTSRALQQTLLDAVSDFVFVLDREANILFANRAVLDRLGCSAPALTGAPAQAVLGLGEAYDAPRGLPVPGNSPRQRQLWLRAADGTRHPVTAHFSYGEWNQEVVVFVVAQPVGAMPPSGGLETMQRARARALDQESDLTRALLHAPLTSAALLDLEGTVLAINEAGARLYGQTVESMVGTNIFHYMEGPVAERRRAVLDRVVTTRQTVNHLDERNSRFFEGYIYPLLDSTGEVRRVAVVSRDVTAEKEALHLVQRQRDLMNDVAQAASQLLALGNLDEGINAALARIGRAVQAERAYVYRIHAHGKSGGPVGILRYEWSSPGTALQSRASMLTDRELSEFGIEHWLEALQHGNSVHGNAADYSPNVRAMLQHYNVASLAVVPVLVEGALWGILGFNTDSESRRQWSDEEISALRTMAASIGAAIHRDEYETRLLREREIADTLREVGLALTSTLDVDEVLQRLLIQVRRVVPFDAANVMWIHDGEARIKIMVGYDQLDINTESLWKVALDVTQVAYMHHLVTTGQPVVCADVTTSPNWVQIPGTEHIQSWLGAPISVFGKVIALFSLDSGTKNSYHDEHVQLIAPFTRQAGIALENAQLFRQVEQTTEELATKYQQLNALHRAIKSVLTSPKADGVLDRLAREIVGIAQSSWAAIYSYETESRSGTLHSVHRASSDAPMARPPARQISFAAPLVHNALERGETVVLSAPDLTHAFPDDPCMKHSLTAILLPLSNQQRTTGAVLICDDRPRRTYSADQVRMCEALANQVAIVIEQEMLLADIRGLERVKSQMIRMASHDLRGPLTRIENYLERLERQLSAAPPAGSSSELAHIRYATREIDQIISEILSLERIEATHRSAQSLRLGALVEECLGTLRAECAAKGLALAVEVTGDLPEIRGDPAQLRGAVHNLLDNAIKYTPTGGQVSVRTYPSAYHGQRTVAFEVEDSGIGIHADRQARLFQPFYRAEQPGAEGIGGTGLGLSVVKGAVEAHGGRVYFDSLPGRGSLFGFWLPLVRD